MTKRKQLHAHTLRFLGDELYIKYRYLLVFNSIWKELDDVLWPICSGVEKVWLDSYDQE